MRQVPENGEILMLSNYRPDYWKNQPKLVTEIITAKDVEDADGAKEVMFKSTNELYLITRCKTHDQACGKFEWDYKKRLIEKPADDFPDWSMIITI